MPADVDDGLRLQRIEARVEEKSFLVVRWFAGDDDVAADLVRELVVDARGHRVGDAAAERDDTGDERELPSPTEQLAARNPFHAPNLPGPC
jgi:hypothetical protein